jgi:hypothetical protein
MGLIVKKPEVENTVILPFKVLKYVIGGYLPMKYFFLDFPIKRRYSLAEKLFFQVSLTPLKS